MATTNAELVYDCHCQLGESPTWDERIQRLYFVDINSKKIHIYDAATKSDTVIHAPLMVSTIIPTPDTDVLIATLHRCSLANCVVSLSDFYRNFLVDLDVRDEP